MRKFIWLILMLFLFLDLFSFCYAFTNEPGAAIRLRQEIWDKVIDLGTTETQPERNFFRFRLQLWDNMKFNDNFGAYIRLTTEPKYNNGPYELTLDRGTNRKNFDQDELVIDNLYVDINKPFDLPVSLRIGRQDFLGSEFYGEGFLIYDGTPGDGTKTFYFNAIRARIFITKGHSVDLVYMSLPKTDIYLPSIHPAYYDKDPGGLYKDHKKRIAASDEQGFWIYGRHKFSESILIEPYYIYKTKDESDMIPVGSHLNTFGLRAVFTLGDNFIKGEIAKQFGEYKNGNDISALGGYLYIGRTFKNCPWTPTLEIGGAYLSGDKPNTKKDEGFDSLFSWAPQWNELLLYTYLPETLSKVGPFPGFWTNQIALITKVKFVPIKDLNITLSYQHLWADEKTNITTGTFRNMFSNNGRDRGDLWMFVAKYKFNEKIDGFFQLEHLLPGNFYSDKARNATFMRIQLQYKI